MSALPKKVQAQVDLANKIVKDIYDAEGKLKADALAAEAVEAQQEPAVQAEAEPPKEPPKVTDQETDWEHKFKVLQGKYNAEVPRLQKQLSQSDEDRREMKQRLLNLEGMLASMQQVKAPAKEPPKPKTPTISDEEREQFGDDLIDLIKRVSLNATLPEIESHLKPLEGRVRQVDEKVASSQKTMAESKRQKVLDELAAAVPNWETQNEDEAFLEWLDQDDPYAGRPRAVLLTEALNAFDSRRVIAFFKGFQSENAAEIPIAPTPAVREPQVKLDDLTAPGTPQTGPAVAPNESGKRVWTRNDIARFYADRNEFVKKGKPIPKELQMLEKDIFAAQAQGRVR